MTPTVAVILPARDAGSTIERTLRSVAAQTEAPDEVVVVDDGSSDQTAALAHLWGHRVVSTTGLGAGAARNVGMTAVSSEYVAFLDADDAWPPGYLAAVDAVLQRGPDVVVADVHRVRGDGSVIERRAITLDELDLSRLVLHNPLTASAMVVRRQLILDMGGFDDQLTYSQDTDLLHRLVASGARVAKSSSHVRYTVRDGREPIAKLREVERSAELRLDKLGNLGVGTPLLSRARSAAYQDLGRRYIKSGYRQEAIRVLFASRSFAALPWFVLALLPRRLEVRIRQLVRNSRSFLRGSDARSGSGGGEPT